MTDSHQMASNSSTSAVSNSAREGRMRELDGWRAVAIFVVLSVHFLEYQHHGLMSRYPILEKWVREVATAAIDTFFVVSGFVIFRLLISEEARFGSVSLKNYYYRRIFRILPAFYIYLAVIFVLLSLGYIHETRKGVLFAGLFLQDLHLVSNGWFTGHAWSLAVEEQFYLVFPVMWVLAPRRFRNLLFLTVFFLCVAWNLSMIFTGWDARISTAIRAGFICISVGVLLAIYEQQARSIANRVPAFVVAIAGLIVVMHPVRPYTWLADGFESLVTPPAIALVLFFSLSRGKWLRGFLCLKPVQALGLSSYGVYLWQQLFTAPRGDFSGAGQIIPQFLPLLLLIVPLSYFFIEKPAMRLGKSLSRRKAVEVPAIERAYEGIR
jgi:peptidoglycan/LPS O-acetylase OafA/YrhL